MVDIFFPTDTKDTIDAIRSTIGREAEFVIVASSTACPDCELDPITNTSDDSFCQTCDGEYWIPVYDYITITGHVSWGQTDDANWQSGGMIYDGSVSLQIEYTPENLILANTAIEVNIDNKSMEIRKKILRGVPELNRIILSLIESEKEV